MISPAYRMCRADWPSTSPLYAGRSIVAACLCVSLLLSQGCQREPAYQEEKQAAASNGDGDKWIRLTAAEAAQAGIETVTVTRGEFRVHRQFPATIQSNENELAEVTTLIGGRIVDVQVDFGQDVQKGTTLALLHSTDLGLAEAAYLKGVAKLHEADLAYRRARNLLDNKAISEAEFYRREAEMKSVRAEAREAKQRLELLGVAEQEIRRLEREQTIRSDVAITAPFAGRVINRNVTRGEIVDQHKRLFTVADLSDVWAVGSVPEKDVQFIRKDQRVEVVAAAYPHAIFPGKITYVADVLDPATRSMRLRVTVPNPEKVLKPEMFALVLVYAAAVPDVVSVPLAAVQSGGADPLVFVRRDELAFEARAVKLGEESGEVVMILDGLQAGEHIVTKGAFVLKSEAEKHNIEPTQ
ncbi:MAG: efflux RND transporter periplasmic adaptor subunit [Nitrospira sp.]